MYKKLNLRRNHLITTRGIGSLYETGEDTYIIAGINFWKYHHIENNLNLQTKIREALEIKDKRFIDRINQETGERINHLMRPPVQFDFIESETEKYTYGDIPIFRFPLWYYCTRCGKMKKVKFNSSSDDSILLCDSNEIYRHPSNTKKVKTCSELKIKQRMVPIRFIMACEQGHLSDFPWVEWAHRDRKDGICDYEKSKENLYLKFSPNNSGLSGLTIQCYNCKTEITDENGKEIIDEDGNVKKRYTYSSLSGAANSQILNKVLPKCPGHLPWLGQDAKEECISKNYSIIQKGASNVYFPEVRSSVYIPSQGYEMYFDIIEEYKDFIFSEPPTISDPNADVSLGDISKSGIDKVAKKVGVDNEILLNAASDYKNKKNNNNHNNQDRDKIEINYKLFEYKTLTGPTLENSDELDHRHLDLKNYCPLIQSIISKIIKVRKIKVTKASLGFYRINPPDFQQDRKCRLFKEEEGKKINWWPAIQNVGEGIFLEFNKDSIDNWIKNNQYISDEITKLRKRALTKESFCPCTNIKPEKDINPKFILLHTFSHLLINEIIISSGYSSSSLQERIYCSDDGDSEMSGILIYIAASEGTGSLGGLSRLLEPENLQKLIEGMFFRFSNCSNDPVCINSTASGTESFNFAACHACALIPETACEFRNLFLDRKTIVGGDKVDGFFQKFFNTNK